jgi:hypothetical protein
MNNQLPELDVVRNTKKNLESKLADIFKVKSELSKINL